MIGVIVATLMVTVVIRTEEQPQVSAAVKASAILRMLLDWVEFQVLTQFGENINLLVDCERSDEAE